MMSHNRLVISNRVTENVLLSGSWPKFSATLRGRKKFSEPKSNLYTLYFAFYFIFRPLFSKKAIFWLKTRIFQNFGAFGAEIWFFCLSWKISGNFLPLFPYFLLLWSKIPETTINCASENILKEIYHLKFDSNDVLCSFNVVCI